jgi:hypothetical protein
MSIVSTKLIRGIPDTDILSNRAVKFGHFIQWRYFIILQDKIRKFRV